MLLADIQDGSLPVGTRLPTTAKLSEQWRVARGTGGCASRLHPTGVSCPSSRLTKNRDGLRDGGVGGAGGIPVR